MYTGKSEWYTSCPICHNNVRVRELRQNENKKKKEVKQKE
jgi:hypothetical protein